MEKTLVNVIKNVESGIKGIVRGVVKGVYSPFLITTAANQYLDTSNKVEDSKKSYELTQNLVESNSQLIGGLWTLLLLTEKAGYYGKGKEYIAALLTTNLIDYAINKYKKQKKKDKLTQQ